MYNEEITNYNRVWMMHEMHDIVFTGVWVSFDHIPNAQ